MRIRLCDPSLSDDLLEFLRSKHCVAEPAGFDTFYVEPPALPLRQAGLLELELYLRVWDALHPGTIQHLAPPTFLSRPPEQPSDDGA